MGEDLWNIYQMTDNIILQMDKAETPENEELFEKLRWLIQELELKVTRMHKSVIIMEDSMVKFMEAHKIVREEFEQKYKKPLENS
jgi:hypothetical protein